MVSGLKSTLENLRNLLDEQDSDPKGNETLKNLKGLGQGTLNRCEQNIRDLAKLLGYESIETNADPKNVKVTFIKKAKWPFKEKEATKILKLIEGHKENLILAMTGDSLELNVEIKETVLEISEKVDNIHSTLLDGRDSKVLAWLSPVDTQANHELARSKREPTTGNWFLESRNFVAWTEGTNTSLWIHGIPGAGKTILCSSIIEYVIKLCESNSRDQYAYFYFDFNEKRSANDMLRSIIVQLCYRKNHVPAELHQLYKQCQYGRYRPQRDNLMNLFAALLTTTYRTFIVLDGLDECSSGPDRDELVEFVTEMIQMPLKYINVMVTSRKEKDINEGLASSVTFSVDLRVEGVQMDIWLHVYKCIERDKRLRTWDLDTKRLALVGKANGM